MSGWYVYMVRCADKSLYTGITTDPERRLKEHNHNDRLAAVYTRHRRPVCLVHQEYYPGRAEALRRECEIKKLSRRGKLILSRQVE
ncbi:MAG: endonuclease [Gammaproteobacteria bacterium RIFCSPLOWO2_02_FULL_56_15]|nr:MAG: endonuclease [Gammaproteobacteria bacterium RIFCSPLOWO2_02_FULL_56_15]